MTKEELKRQVCAAIDAQREKIMEIGEWTLRHPETAFREWRTSAMVKEFFQSLKLPVREPLAVTGCRADLKSGKPGPAVALLGELDAIILPEHPYADPETGAAHACGHHAQITALLGAAIGLTSFNLKEFLSGNIALIAVPAEEHHPENYYEELLSEHRISRTSGKQQLIGEGVFDDVDIAMMMHSGHADFTPSGFNGFLIKKIVFSGRAAHAGLSPEAGINALSMARLALSAVDFQRDTFRDSDAVRIHGMIQEGGNAINVVPSRVTATCQIRAKTTEALLDASGKVDRSVQAAALAFGGGAEITTESGYLPFKSSAGLEKIHEDNLNLLDPDSGFYNFGHRGSSTDMGDVSMIMPALHAYTGGTGGTPHARDFVVTDPDQAYLRPAKLLAMNAVELLYGNAESAYAVLKTEPELTREDYKKLYRESNQTKHWNYMK